MSEQKKKLRLDEISVESFVINEKSAKGGTGTGCRYPTLAIDNTCDGHNAGCGQSEFSCDGAQTCGQSCAPQITQVGCPE